MLFATSYVLATSSNAATSSFLLLVAMPLLLVTIAYYSFLFLSLKGGACEMKVEASK